MERKEYLLKIKQTKEDIKNAETKYKDYSNKNDIIHNLKISLDIQEFNLKEGRF